MSIHELADERSTSDFSICLNTHSVMEAKKRIESILIDMKDKDINHINIDVNFSYKTLDI